MNSLKCWWKKYLNLFSLFLLTNVIIEGAGLNWCWKAWLLGDSEWVTSADVMTRAWVMTKYTQKMTHIAPTSVTSSQSEARNVRSVTNERPASWHLIVSVTQYSVSFVTFVSWGADNNMYDAADVRNQKCVYHSQHILENGWPRVSLFL